MNNGVIATHLFVYGTLMRRFHNPAARRLRRDALFVCTATVSGKLYNLGAYPGLHLTREGACTAHGEVYRLTGGGQLLHFLDGYEGCAPDDPEPHTYRREVAHAALAGGGQLPVWVYALIEAPASRPVIPAGRFGGGSRRSLRQPLLEAPPLFR
jgi:gamma-glutamylcyclotransferase (GGCT)/AIG2-like uncharacterized protein YtfP